MLTVKELSDLMTHAIGRTPAPGHNLRQTLNRAGRRLVDRFNWSWKTAGPVDLTSAAGDEGKDYIPLDAAHGFTGFISLEAMTDGLRCVRAVTPSEMLRLKQTGATGDERVVSFVTDDLPTTLGTSLPTPRVWLLETLATGSAGTVIGQVLYRRGWIDVATSGAGDDNKKPPIPDAWEDALVKLCRSMAHEMEFESTHPDAARAEEAIQLLIARDVTRQTYRGQIRGGADDMPAYVEGASRPAAFTRFVGGP
jgi:hypothetical protein